jgi:hypothetical protein
LNLGLTDLVFKIKLPIQIAVFDMVEIHQDKINESRSRQQLGAIRSQSASAGNADFCTLNGLKVRFIKVAAQSPLQRGQRGSIANVCQFL